MFKQNTVNNTKEFKSATDYVKFFQTLVKLEADFQEIKCKDFTQKDVTVNPFKIKKRFQSPQMEHPYPEEDITANEEDTLKVQYAELDRSNGENFQNKLKEGDTLILIDEINDWKAKVYVENRASSERVLVSLSKEAECVNYESRFTVEIRFDDTASKRALKALEDFAAGTNISKEIKSVILSEISLPMKKKDKGSANKPLSRLIPDPSVLDKLGLNESQKEAAIKALGLSPLVLIQGPPGTGKSTTAAVIIIHLAKNTAGDDKILVCAPSNGAVDNIVESLIAKGPDELIVRIYASSLQKDQIKPELKKVALHEIIQKKYPEELKFMKMKNSQLDRIDEEEMKRLSEFKKKAEKEAINSAKIVCCTCTTAGAPILDDHTFKYVLIDEAAQATEPECLLPMLHNAEKVILAGDHKQIRPIITNIEALDLGITMFERLMPKTERCMLKWQYRMHPKISEFPSSHFYNGELNTHLSVSRPVNSKFFWPKKDIPLFFYHLNEQEEKSVTGGSYSNKNEAETVLHLINRLTLSGVKAGQIGVITPYNGQKFKLLEMLQEVKYTEIQVASVDGFQGGEKDYIIMSCVRSNKYRSIGFLYDQRRLNVAITRPRFGLIICGNAELLATNWNWRKLLEYYKRHDIIVEHKSGKWISSDVDISGN